MTPLPADEDAAWEPQRDLSPPFNGAYALAREGDAFHLTPSASYWDQALPRPEALVTLGRPKDASSTAALDAFAKGEIALLDGVTPGALRAHPDYARLASSLRHRVRGGIVALVFNQRSKVAANAALRRALRAVINLEDLVQATDGATSLAPMRGLVPPLLPGARAEYGAEYGVAYETSPAAALPLLADAKKALGTSFPKALTIVAIDGKGTRAELDHLAQFVQANLELPVTPRYVAAKDFANAAAAPDTVAAYVRATPKTQQPGAYLAMYASDAPFHDLAPWPKDWLAQVQAAERLKTLGERLARLSDLEHRAVDDAWILGLAAATEGYLLDPTLVGVTRRAGAPDPDLTRAKRLALSVDGAATQQQPKR